MTGATLGGAGAPINELWGWVVITPDGKEALCCSPWSLASILVGPDRDRIATKAMGDWCRAYYEPHGMTVELRRFEVAAVFQAGRFEHG